MISDLTCTIAKLCPLTTSCYSSSAKVSAFTNLFINLQYIVDKIQDQVCLAANPACMNRGGSSAFQRSTYNLLRNMRGSRVLSEGGRNVFVCFSV